MRLDRLIAAELAGEAAGVEITGLAYDSRDVAPGHAVLLRAAAFAATATSSRPRRCAAGAAALVVERPLGLGVPEVVVESARAAMAPAAARFYGEPARELRVVGITGTNGKTTTAYLVRALLEAAGEQCGLLGTVKSVIGGEERAVARTTAGGDRPAGGPARDARRRRPRVRDGGLLARAGAGAHRRDRIRGGGVHEPDPGPPRLPREHGGLLPGQAAAVPARGVRPAPRRR